jgi:hypothetical protein
MTNPLVPNRETLAGSGFIVCPGDDELSSHTER